MRNRLIFTDGTTTTNVLYDADLLKSPSFKRCVNPDEDLTPGTVAAAELKFNIDISYGLEIGDMFRWQTQYTSDLYSDHTTWNDVGYWIIKEISRNGNVNTVTCYDNVIKTDVDVSTYLAGLSYPITLKNLFKGVCEQCGVSYVNDTFPNEDFEVTKPLLFNSITGRSMLSYIASAAGGFIIAWASGGLHVNTFDYGTESAVYDWTKYQSLEYGEDDITDIDAVRIIGEDGNILSQYPAASFGNWLEISGNPIFNGASVADAYAAAQEIYNVVHFGTPTTGYGNLKSGKMIISEPNTLQLLSAGACCFKPVIWKDQTSQEAVLLPYTVEFDNTSCTYTCTGNKTRKIETSTATKVTTLENQYNYLSDNKVDTTGGASSTFAWTFDEDGVVLTSNGLQVLRADETGLEVNGKVTSESGSIGNLVVNSNGLTYSNYLKILSTPVTDPRMPSYYLFANGARFDDAILGYSAHSTSAGDSNYWVEWDSDGLKSIYSTESTSAEQQGKISYGETKLIPIVISGNSTLATASSRRNPIIWPGTYINVPAGSTVTIDGGAVGMSEVLSVTANIKNTDSAVNYAVGVNWNGTNVYLRNNAASTQTISYIIIGKR